MDNRPEGVYVSASIAGISPYAVRLFDIQRVNGNATVTSVEITEGEAAALIDQLQALGVKSRLDGLRSGILNEDYVQRLR